MSQKIKVLYAEDEQDIRENMVEILRDEGFEVFEASNGKEAVEIFLENKPDVVVSDIMMPELSGHELLKIIRENDNIPNNNVPFIFLTALGQKEDIVKGIDLKANDYLTKPIDFELLIAKIKEKFNNHTRIQSSHKEDIKGIKNQVSEIVPSELMRYLDQIQKISKNLKTEPYGPFPHRKYLENIGQIYMSSIKMKSIIDNFISGEAIENQLSADEDIINPSTLIGDFISSLDGKLQSKIIFSPKQTLPNIKVDKKLIIETLRKIFGSIFKVDVKCSVEVSIVEDYTQQLVFIFYPDSSVVNQDSLSSLLNKEKLNEILEKYGYNFDILFKEDGTSILLYIPNYRVVQK
jgi:CheY-like chemotaxis protein